MKPKNDTGPAKRHVDPFTAAQQGAVRTEQRQQAERARAEECQANARDLGCGLIPGLADEVRRELAKTSARSDAAHGHQSLVVVAPARDAAPNSLNLHYGNRSRTR